MNRVATLLAAEPAGDAAATDLVVCQYSTTAEWNQAHGSWPCYVLREPKSSSPSSVDSAGSFSSPSKQLLDQLAAAFHGDNAAGLPRAPMVLLWPTSEEVRDSVEGYRAGGCMPSSTKNVSRAPRAMLRKWSGPGSDYVTARRRAMPHIKTWSRVAANGRDVRWSLLSSSNLSGGAHGKRQKPGPDPQLHIMYPQPCGRRDAAAAVARNLFRPGTGRWASSLRRRPSAARR